MKSSVISKAMTFGLVAVGLATGFFLIVYSDADDAPGGVLLGLLLMVGMMALGIRTALESPGGRLSPRAIEERFHGFDGDLQSTQTQIEELQTQVAQLDEKLAFTQSLLESRDPAGRTLPAPGPTP